MRRNRTLLVIGAVIFVAATAAGCNRGQDKAAPAAASDDTWAVVDGRTITRQDVEKAFSRSQDPAQPLSGEEAMTAKLSLLNEMIVQDILLARARAMKIEIPQSELDTKYNEAKQNLSEAQFQEELKKRNLTAEDMREGLRRELTTNKLMDQEVTSKVSVTDQDVTDYFNANRAQFNLAEDAYRVGQLVVTPSPSPDINNRLRDDAATPQTAAAKVQMLMQRLKEGAQFSQLVMDYSEDPESTPRGGDMGFLPVSRLQQAPPPLRDAVLKGKVGTAKVVSAPGAHTIVLIIAYEKAGQRDLSAPEVKENITQTLKTRREQLLRTAYLSAARADAQVTNHAAKRVVQAGGKM